MRFFFDNNFSRRLIDFLNDLAQDIGHECIHLQDMFEAETPDDEWIPELAKSGNWIVLTLDLGISKKPAGRLALQESGLTVFFFPKKHSRLNIWKQSWRIIKVLQDIIPLAKKYPKGKIFRLDANYKIQIWE